jgi:hypothetical protein
MFDYVFGSIPVKELDPQRRLAHAKYLLCSAENPMPGTLSTVKPAKWRLAYLAILNKSAPSDRVRQVQQSFVNHGNPLLAGLNIQPQINVVTVQRLVHGGKDVQLRNMAVAQDDHLRILGS